MSKNNHIVWISWENQRRTVEMSSHFGAELKVLTCESRFRLTRYIHLSFRTLLLLFKNKFSYVFCQNPSIVLALLLGLVKNLFGFTLIVDRHSNFVISTDNKATVFLYNFISDLTLKLSNFTIVTNDFLKNFVNQRGGNALVLQDKIPDMDQGRLIDLGGRLNIVFITSFSFDEPIEEVIYAFEKIDKSVNLYITGNYKKNKFVAKYINKKPNNIIFTGFLSEEEYQSLLKSSDAIIVLTKLENLLTCGAYEGVSLCKPLVLSNTETIKKYFTSGAIYCDCDINSIKTSIEKCMNNLTEMEGLVCAFKQDAILKWHKTFAGVCSIIFRKN